jgi:carboxypeptidase T
MKKTIIMMGILLIIYPVVLNLYGQRGTDEWGDTVISMRISDYRTYLKNHPPLDRLYRRGDTCFFLVDREEYKTLEQSGAAILTQEPPDSLLKKLPRIDALSLQAGDINGAYHNYNETRALLQDLESRFPSLAQVTNTGYSIEGRELNVIKISDNVSSEEQEPNIFIVGCHHAREWISVEVPLLFAQYLLENYPGNPEVRRAVNGAQIYIMPLANPDGLEYSIHTYRMWRKNRRYNGSFSWGVDINRNYGYMWGYDNNGSSPNPWSEVYRGPAPFSEPEIDAVRQFLLDHPPAGALSYHNYGQLILYPWGYTYTPAPDAEEMHMIGQGMGSRMFQVTGRVYEVGSSEALYLTNGGTIDWVYGVFGAPSYTIELPPDSFIEGGFFTSLELINSTFAENLPALLYFVNYFVTEDNREKSREIMEDNKMKNPKHVK